MADSSDLNIQVTLSVGELRDVVALVNLASENLPEDQRPEIIADLSEMYFELMEDLRADGILGRFQPE